MHTTSPKVLLARQPIIDRRRQVVAYELLYRSRYEREGAFFIDNALATADAADAADAAFHRIGIQAVVGRTRAVINVDADYLLSPSVERLRKKPSCSSFWKPSTPMLRSYGAAVR